MAMENGEYEFNVEHNFHDVIHIICKYLRLRDLRSLSKVCKSWRVAAWREEKQRFYLQEMRLHPAIDNLSSVLDRTPLASILVYETSLETSLLDRSGGPLETKLLACFNKQLPNTTIVLRVDKYLSTEETELQPGIAEQNDLKLPGNSEILGMFVPSSLISGNIRVKFSTWFSFQKHFHRSFNRDQIFDNLVEDLGLNDSEYPKSTIIMLAPSHLLYSADLINLDRRIKQSGQEITWACLFGVKLVAGNSIGDDRYELIRNEPLWLRISGPTVESWSTFIYFHARKEEIERKLQQLKGHVKSKRNYTGLLYAPRCGRAKCNHAKHPCGDSDELMNSLKRIFPEIGFTGLFLNSAMDFIEDPANDIDNDVTFSLNDHEIRRMDLPMYASIIIVSSD